MKTTILQQIRKQKQLTQMEVAKESKTSIRNYQYIEHGITTPSVKTAINIAKVLNTTVERLFS